MSTPDEALARLEGELAAARRFGARALRQLHRRMLDDLRESRKETREQRRRAERAERRLALVESRAARLESELAQVRSSATWRAGRAVLAVPVRVRRAVRRR